MTKRIFKKIGILGGGIAGLSIANFLNEKSVVILEKETKVGGLCRSYNAGGVSYDIGPHIMFSKNPEVLRFMTTIIPTNRIKRSNLIFLNGRYIKYPFENFLGQLKDKKIIDYCLNAFLHNTYKDMPAENMLAFFLKTFGEGITRTYLQPYNEKIWKFDPSMLDTQMVDRIPKPPDEHIINSAKGKYSEGYLHQLFFYYPKKGGYQSMVDAVAKKISEKGVEIYAGKAVINIRKDGRVWRVKTPAREYVFNRIVNCMPVHELMKVLADVPQNILETAGRLLYNSIYIIIVNVKKENVGRHFAFIDSKKDVNFTDFRKEKYAYVMYTLNHRRDTDAVLSFLRNRGIESTGRFAEFEYMNSDKVIEHSMSLAEKMNKK